MASMQRRVEGTTVACPFVYGSIAHWMGKKADEFATHKWTLYIRGPNMEDMSSFISRVVFTLHPSFAAPIRGTYAFGFFSQHITAVPLSTMHTNS